MLYEKSKAKKIISNNEEIRKLVVDTINKMATITGATLGPGGRAVLIEREGMPPLSTKDGVTVVKSLGTDNAEANIIVEACKEISMNTAKDAGDGTTTAIVLANAIVQHGIDFVANNTKYNPQRIVSELEELYDDLIVPHIKKRAKAVNDEEKLRHVATISANGDKKIANIVVTAVIAAGEDGHIILEEAQGDEMRVETIDGYIVTSGLKELGQLGPMFINDRTNQQCKMDNGFVFLYNGSINDLKVTAFIQDAIEGTELYGSPLLIIAHDFADNVIDMLAKNVKGGITICPIKTPRSGLPNSKTVFLEDMAAYTGSKVFDPSNVESITADDFGQFTFAKSNTYETLIVANPSAEQVASRIEELKALENSCFSEMDKMHIRANIAKLDGGIATIFVGGVSDLKVRERKARVEDAVEAVRSAIAEGTIAGGCAIQLELADLIDNHKDKKESWIIMSKALREPFKLLLTNCGEDHDDILSKLTKGKVFDANEHKFVDPYKAGIIEPAKVARVAIGNALSVATLLITCGGIVCTPSNPELESQLAMSKQAFKDMMSTAQ